jgi:hypothetical protein
MSQQACFYNISRSIEVSSRHQILLVHMHEPNDQKTCSLHNENHDIHLSQSTLSMVKIKGWPNIQFKDDNFIKLCC